MVAIKMIVTLGLLFWFCQTAHSQTSSEKPNIVLILADDLGYADLSVNGSLQIQTPHIDALAAEGIRFSQAYVSSAVCSPSRAGLLTGKNQVKFGYDNNLSENVPGFDPEYAGLPVNEVTVAKRLKENGYLTGLIGKWHLGSKEQFHPTNRGFDEFWGYLNGGHNYFRSEENGKGYLGPILSNYKTPQEITYLTDDKGDECVDFIVRHKDEPFFLFASFNAPHTPLQATEEDLELFSHIKDKNRRTYLAMVHRLDINVGRIVKALEENGISENTLIVFLSDNGGPVDQNFSNNAPFNGQKGILLDGGIRVPFLMKWDGVLPKGIVYDNAISSLDLTPTFLQMAGIKTTDEDEFDGVDLFPFLKSQSEGIPHETLKWRFTISAGIIKGNWKLVRIPDRLPMLFDLSEDISEQNNVSLENLTITNQLLKELGTWDISLPNPLFQEGPYWRGVQLDLYDKDYQLKQPESD